jgi:Sulfatase
VPISGGPYGLVQWEETIAKVLSKKGYATGHFGKWHLGNVEGRSPTDQGFDEWYGIADSSDETLWSAQPGFDPSVAHTAYIYEGNQGSPTRQVKPYDLTTRPEIDMEITDKVIDFMQRNATTGKPFYAYVPFTLVHYPTLPSAEFKGATGHGDWADCLAQIDHNVGRLLNAVESLSLALRPGQRAHVGLRQRRHDLQYLGGYRTTRFWSFLEDVSVLAIRRSGMSYEISILPASSGCWLAQPFLSRLSCVKLGTSATITLAEDRVDAPVSR